MARRSAEQAAGGRRDHRSASGKNIRQIAGGGRCFSGTTSSRPRRMRDDEGPQRDDPEHSTISSAKSSQAGRTLDRRARATGLSGRTDPGICVREKTGGLIYRLSRFATLRRSQLDRSGDVEVRMCGGLA